MEQQPFEETAQRQGKLRLRSSMSRKSGTEAGSRIVPLARSVSHTMASRSGSANGGGWSKTPSSTLKMAVLAPNRRARVRTATTVNTGLRAKDRNA